MVTFPVTSDLLYGSAIGGGGAMSEEPNVLGKMPGG